MVFCWHVSVGPSLRVQSSYRSFMFFKRSGQRNPRGGGGGGGGVRTPCSSLWIWTYYNSSQKIGKLKKTFYLAYFFTVVKTWHIKNTAPKVQHWVPVTGLYFPIHYFIVKYAEPPHCYLYNISSILILICIINITQYSKLVGDIFITI